MLSNKRQTEYFQQEKESLINHLQAFLKKKSISDLHRFRVSCKRINTLVQLHRKAHGNTEIKSAFAPVKELFAISGKIREIQMHIRLLSEIHPQPAELIKKLQKEEEQLSVLLIRNGIKKLSTSVLSLGHLQDQLKEIKKKQIEKLIRKQVNRIDEQLDPEISAEELHEVRKQIKFLVYLSELGKNTGLRRDYLHLCEELIGEWHDVNLLNFWFSQQNVSSKMIAHFDKKEQKLLRQMARQMKNFRKKIH